MSFLSSAYAQYLKKGSTSKYTEIIGEPLRDGGKDPAATTQPTRSSDVSSSYQKTAVRQFTQDTFRVNETLQMPPRGAVTLQQIFYSRPSQCRQSSSPSSQTLTHNNLAREPVIRGLAHKRVLSENRASNEAGDLKRQKTNDTRPHNLSIPPTINSAPS